MRVRLLGVLAVAAAVFGCAPQGDPFVRNRQAMLDRDRTIVYNTDGCDMLFYPNSRAVSIAEFQAERLDYARGTEIRTVSYCPISSGFGYFTLFRVGDPLMATWDDNPKAHNAAKEFWDKFHTDCLEMAMSFCRSNGFERLVSIRMNDTHDALHTPEKPDFLFSPFKKRHPECLMAPLPARPGDPKRYGSWTAVDYAHPLVRSTMCDYVRDFCETYDVDGVELDFCRHLLYFKSVFEGGVASKAELALMNGLMRDIRLVVENAARRKGHPILVFARVPDSVGYAAAIGLDLETWLAKGFVDGLVCGCYFQLNQWKTMADLCHAQGRKMYASLDESRIRENKDNPGIIVGRGTRAWYLARYSAAMAAGADGVYLFNLEHEKLHDYAGVDPRETDGLDKIYFATDRGSGGYRVWNFLKTGAEFINMPRLEPGDSQRIMPGKSYAFDLMIGDDFSKAAACGKVPVIEVKVLTDQTSAGGFGVRLGDEKLEAGSFQDGLFTCQVPADRVTRGLNRFELVNSGARPLVARDFAVKIAYVQKDHAGCGSSASVLPAEHVALCVSEPKAVVDWWVKNLGCKVTLNRSGGSCFIAGGEGRIAFEVYGPSEGLSAPDYGKMDVLQLHFGFSTSDVDGTVRRLVDAGATLVARESVPGLEGAILRDPFGIPIQVVRRERSVLR